MTTFTDFLPTPLAAFQFQPVLDGATYNAIITWNTYGQRWYMNLYDQTGTRIVTIAMVGSPNDRDISLVAGYFTSTLVFRQSSQQFEVSP